MLRCARNDGARGGKLLLQPALSFPRKRESSTPRPLGSIMMASGILDRPPARTMTSRMGRRARLLILAARFARVLLDLSTLWKREGAGKTGCRPAPAVRCANCTRRKNRTAAYRCGRAHGLPCAMVGRLMPCSPGSRCFFLASLTLAEVTSRRAGWHGAASTRLDRGERRSGPHGFAVRVQRRSSDAACEGAHEARLNPLPRPALRIRDNAACVHRRPDPRLVTTYDRPSSQDRDGRHIRQNRISVKWNILTGAG